MLMNNDIGVKKMNKKICNIILLENCGDCKNLKKIFCELVILFIMLWVEVKTEYSSEKEL